MADEKHHGLGFPNRDENKDGIEELVEKVLDELGNAKRFEMSAYNF